MIVAIFNAIAALPAILNLCKQFVTWMSNHIEMAEKRKKAEEMAKATEKAKEKKDTSDMDNLFGGGKK